MSCLKHKAAITLEKPWLACRKEEWGGWGGGGAFVCTVRTHKTTQHAGLSSNKKKVEHKVTIDLNVNTPHSYLISKHLCN